MSVQVLIIRLSAIGDVVHTLPVAAALKHQLGDVKITWVVEPLAAPVVQNNPAVDEVLIFKGKALLGALNPFALKPKELVDTVRLIEQLRARHFDIALDVQGLLKSAVITYLSGAPVRIGFRGAREFSERFMTHLVDVGDYFGHEKHVVKHNLSLVKRALELLDVKDPELLAVEFSLPKLSAQALDMVAAMVQPPAALSEESSVSYLPAKPTAVPISATKPLTVLIPGTTWEAKTWAVDHWSGLAQSLITALDCRLILVGGPADRIANEIIEKNLRQAGFCDVVNLTGQTSILDLVALFKLVQLVVGADCGPLHIAAACRAPKVVGILGSTPVRRNGPYGDQCLSISLGLDCQPCFAKVCPLGTTACLKEMPADFVMAKLLPFVAGAGSDGAEKQVSRPEDAL